MEFTTISVKRLLTIMDGDWSLNLVRIVFANSLCRGHCLNGAELEPKSVPNGCMVLVLFVLTRLYKSHNSNSARRYDCFANFISLPRMIVFFFYAGFLVSRIGS